MPIFSPSNLLSKATCTTTANRSPGRLSFAGAGADLSPDDARASARHTRFRAATDHYVRAYASNSAYEIASVYASYSRWERDTALVGHAELDDDDDASTEEQAWRVSRNVSAPGGGDVGNDGETAGSAVPAAP